MAALLHSLTQQQYGAVLMQPRFEMLPYQFAFRDARRGGGVL